MSEVKKINTGSDQYQSHESAYIDDGAVIGGGTTIWHFTHIQAGAVLGRDCRIGQNVLISPTARLGNNVKVQSNVSVYDGVILEDGVFCGPSCVFTNVINPRALIERKDEYKTTLVKKGASIGANATIVCGVVLGRYCFIGAGSVVTKDIKDHSLAFGNPAQHRGWVCECGNQLDQDLNCPVCGKKYNETKEGLISV